MDKITRKQKREKEKEINYFGEFSKIKNHFFKDLNKKLAIVKDKRKQSYVTYTPEIILFTVIMKNVSGIVSMNKMTKDFNNDAVIENIAASLGYESLEEIPHYDTINNFLKELEVSELEKIRDYMIRELFKKRSLEKYRLMDKYWCIAIDGSQLFSFNEKHCDHCLKKEYKNKETGEVEKTVYYHTVLEAKLVLGDMVFSILTEFVENETESVSKQDCEINAAKRLMKKLKYKFRKLNICLLGDSLYACEPIYQLCDEYNWKFIFRFKEGRAQKLWEEIQVIKGFENNELNSKFVLAEQEVIWDATYINEVSYKNIFINTVDFTETIFKKSKDKDSREKTSKNFVFVTNIQITKINAFKIVSAGRSRWKIENEGFNNQKNIRYDIEHACCLNYQAMKNHYLLIQISDILRQLLENGSVAIRELKVGIKEISSRILESFRRDTLISEDISRLNQHIKIRDL
ncbi:transposase family protein [Clostridium manihotivorum]|uniref:Transposase n=2 Tax=Clostridium manihotivorum TaxID=2320868 RepID=A0A3R5QSP8_9CLOT|nr:transposase family protein [Clostridium manihotivorum]QAA31705.1 transposase [Clostridium manihotivorum]